MQGRSAGTNREAQASSMSRSIAEQTDCGVLVVDPDRFARGLVMQMLRDFGIAKPEAVSDGGSAQAILAANPIRLCLCEAALPDMGSSELIRWIRQRAPEDMRQIPVIVLTAQTQLSVVTEARASGATIVVKKPISARVLREHVDWAARSVQPLVLDGSRFATGASLPQSPEGGDGEEREPDPNAIVGGEIAAIGALLSAPANDTARLREGLLAHGMRIAGCAGRAGYAHLEIAARGLCDAASGVDLDDTESLAPVLVHMQALQLLINGQEGLTPRGADRILEELANLLRRRGLEGARPRAIVDPEDPARVTAP